MVSTVSPPLVLLTPLCCCPLNISFRGYHGDPHKGVRGTRLGGVQCVVSLAGAEGGRQSVGGGGRRLEGF